MSLKAENVDTLVMSGGGLVGGISLSKALIKLTANNMLDLKIIKEIRGTSIGSIIGFCLCLDLDATYIYNKIVTSTFFDNLSFFTPSVWENFGLCDGDKLKKLVEEDMKNIKMNININFKDFYTITKINFMVVATDMMSKSETVFSHMTTPKCSVIDAVIASSAFPMMFSPKKIKFDSTHSNSSRTLTDYRIFIDGGIKCNFPIMCEGTLPCNPKKTIGIYIKKESTDYLKSSMSDPQFYSILDYSSSLLHVVTESLFSMQENLWRDQNFTVLKINTPSYEPWKINEKIIEHTNILSEKSINQFIDNCSIIPICKNQSKSTQTD